MPGVFAWKHQPHGSLDLPTRHRPTVLRVQRKLACLCSQHIANLLNEMCHQLQWGVGRSNVGVHLPQHIPNLICVYHPARIQPQIQQPTHWQLVPLSTPHLSLVQGVTDRLCLWEWSREPPVELLLQRVSVLLEPIIPRARWLHRMWVFTLVF
eukprot:TRINITY_DN4550_c0_g2_i1.p1 TRINITY_DN4550_c0_g2~~TRINITY_DN4550_c0_g2_i1.p1  ORF type:complete len:153 (+),score=12.21 TRINITY_DN4550_c0_g2_i1:248-706(+)